MLPGNDNRITAAHHSGTPRQEIKKRFPVFLRSFLAFSKIASIAPCKGGLERNLLSRLANPQAVRGGRAKRKCVLFVWQFLIFGGVVNERKMKKFPKISVNFTLRGVVGIRGRNISAALAESPPRPSRVLENSMRNFRRNATNQPPIAG